jgi:hypothetical protein
MAPRALFLSQASALSAPAEPKASNTSQEKTNPMSAP